MVVNKTEKHEKKETKMSKINKEVADFYCSVDRIYNALYEVRDYINYLYDNLYDLKHNVVMSLAYDYNKLLETNSDCQDFMEKLKKSATQARKILDDFRDGQAIELANISPDEFIHFIKNVNDFTQQCGKKQEQHQKKVVNKTENSSTKNRGRK